MSDFSFENIHPVYFKNLDSRRVGWSCIRKKIRGIYFLEFHPPTTHWKFYTHKIIYTSRKKNISSIWGGKIFLKMGRGIIFHKICTPGKNCS